MQYKQVINITRMSKAKFKIIKTVWIFFLFLPSKYGMVYESIRLQNISFVGIFWGVIELKYIYPQIVDFKVHPQWTILIEKFLCTIPFGTVELLHLNYL